MRTKLRHWIAEMRLPFLTASIVPVVLGAILAWYHMDRFYWGYFLLTLFGGMFLHIGTNVCNDYFDHKSGCDDMNTEFVRPFSGGSRLIQKGLLTPSDVLTEGVLFLVLGSIIGLYLTYLRGTLILFLGIIGAFSGYFYTAPPFRLGGRGIGELVIGLNFGTLMVLGSYYVQAQALSVEAAVASVPVAVLIALVVWINEFPDYTADQATGKRTLVVRLGKQKAARVYIWLLAATYLWIVVAVVLRILSLWALLSLLAIPWAIKAIRIAQRHYSDTPKLIPANATTILLHMLTGLLLAGGYVLAKLI